MLHLIKSFFPSIHPSRLKFADFSAKKKSKKILLVKGIFVEKKTMIIYRLTTLLVKVILVEKKTMIISRLTTLLLKGIYVEKKP